MNSHWAKTCSSTPTGCSSVVRLAAAMLVLLFAYAVAAEEAQQPPPTPPVQEQQNKDTGLFESIVRWFEGGFANFKSGIKDAKGNIDNVGDKAATVGRNIGDKAVEVGKGAAGATKEAVDAMVKLPSTRVVVGRERCEISPNGAPDCRAAAETICHAKGFAGGQSVDFVSAEKCPAAVWMNRRKPAPGECTTETFVTRAMCQ